MELKKFLLYAWFLDAITGTAMILKAVVFEKVRNYEASIYEWSNDLSMPMKSGT